MAEIAVNTAYFEPKFLVKKKKKMTLIRSSPYNLFTTVETVSQIVLGFTITQIHYPRLYW